MKSVKFPSLKFSSLKFSSFIIFLSLWSAVAYSGVVPAIFLPTPTDVSHEIIEMTVHGGLMLNLMTSAVRMVMGFIIACLIAVPVGVAIGVSRRLSEMALPFIAFFRYIPPSGFIPLSVLWFGIGEIQKSSVIFITVAPYLALLVSDEVMRVPEETFQHARMLGLGRLSAVMRVVVPYSSPGIWDAIRLMFGAIWTMIVIVEMMASDLGVGHMIIQAQRYLLVDKVMAILVVLGLLGLITDRMFEYGYKRIFPWSAKGDADDRT